MMKACTFCSLARFSFTYLPSAVHTHNIGNHKRHTETNVQASLGDRPPSWLYSPGRNRRGAAAGPAGVRAEGGGRLRTAGPGPEGSWDTALERSGRGLEDQESTLGRHRRNSKGVDTAGFDRRTNQTVLGASLCKPTRSEAFKGTTSESSPKFCSLTGSISYLLLGELEGFGWFSITNGLRLKKKS